MGIAKLPRVGVVIANHNNEAYVAEAIVSAARQTVRNIEVVVVDDASTDCSDKAIRETLAKTGDNTKIMLTGEYGLQLDNAKAAGVRLPDEVLQRIDKIHDPVIERDPAKTAESSPKKREV